jgi:hypothetical protein
MSGWPSKISSIFRGPARRYLKISGYPVTIGLAKVCLAPNRQEIAVKSFLVQSDIGNAGIINCLDNTCSLLSGVQLDAGRAWVFSVSQDNLLVSPLAPTPMEWANTLHEYGKQYGGNQDNSNIFLNIADFYAIADAAGQNLRIVYFGIAS